MQTFLIDLSPAQAIDYFLSLPANRDISQYNLSPMEWQVLKDFELVLEVCFAGVCRLELVKQFIIFRYRMVCSRAC
jgi:hypothetical protein